MAEENFNDQDISEQVTGIKDLPIFCGDKIGKSRLSLLHRYPLAQSKSQFENINIEKLLGEMECQTNKESEKQKLNPRQTRTMSKGENTGADKKEIKLMQLREEKERKQLKDCTFQPNIHSRVEKINAPKRTLEEFLQGQNNFVRKANAKKEIIKQHLNQKQRHQFRPSINSNYSRQQRPIHQRLYQLRQKQQVLVVPSKQERFRPSISNKSKKMVRNQEIGKHLYEDALRRQSKKSEPSIHKFDDKPVNLKNEKYVAQRFIKQLYNVLSDMKIDLNNDLEYLTFNELLFKLGFVTYLEEVQNKYAKEQRALVYEAYSLLSQAQSSIKNICLFLLALIGVYHIDPINFPDSEPSNNIQLHLDQSEGRKIQKHFDLLYRNRLFAESSRRHTKTQESIVSYSFKPQINPQSDVMAENFRNKILKETATIIGQTDMDLSVEGIKHTDLLVLNRISKQKLREEIRVQQEQKQLRQCTFKPTIIEKRQQNANTSFEQGSSKCIQLYNLHKKRLSKNDIAQFNHAPKDTQCTFAPNIGRKPSKSISTIPRNSDKQVLRMIQSRKQKQEIDKFLTRGYDKTSLQWKDTKKTKQPQSRNSAVKKNSIATQENQQETPFLVIDVNLGTQIDHITVFRSDIDKADVLADEFAIKHNLDQETKNRLVDLLYQQINNVIQKIQSEDEK